MQLSTANPVNTTTAGETGKGEPPTIAARNACKLCSPLGAAMVFKGIRGCLPFLHGSQGCATYIRRYMISHFREPVDIASSSFSEDDAIFGGARNFAAGVSNVISQYEPELIGVATTCLSETIGDNMLGMIKDYKEGEGLKGPPMVSVSTPSYTGTHSDGYYAAIKAIVEEFAEKSGPIKEDIVNILPTMMSCSDLRHIRELCHLYELKPLILPDYNTTLEGETWDTYHKISPGGTSMDEIRSTGSAVASIEMGHLPAFNKVSAGDFLQSTFEVKNNPMAWPIGLRLNDLLFTTLSEISGKKMPESLRTERGRLIDAYVDAHKYTAGKTAAIFGEADLVISMAAFLSEIGIRPILCGTGKKLSNFREIIRNEINGDIDDIVCLSGADHAKISEETRKLKPDLLIGSSKGYPLSRELGIPLLRVGFPIHDRFGAQRQLTIGYRGAQELFDRIVNLLLEAKQEKSITGYSYI